MAYNLTTPGTIDVIEANVQTADCIVTRNNQPSRRPKTRRPPPHHVSYGIGTSDAPVQEDTHVAMFAPRAPPRNAPKRPKNVPRDPESELHDFMQQQQVELTKKIRNARS